MDSLFLIAIVIFLAWSYDFWNGANDRANAIATTVSTGALSYKTAGILSAIFNLFGAFITTEVAKTIGKGILPQELISQEILIFALSGAIFWTALSTKFGFPISVTHSLIGGLLGTGLVSFGFGAIKIEGLLKVIKGMLGAPIISFVASALMVIFLSHFLNLFSKKFSGAKINRLLRRGQILTTLSVSLTHGMNDTQNAMGIITASLFAGGFLSEFKVPFWVVFGSGFFMALGTLLAGHRVTRTVGKRIYKIQPLQGFSTEASSALLIFLHSLAGIPLSTTQVVTAGVMGVGGVERKSQVNWHKVIEIFFTWIFTIPGAGIISGFLSLIFHLIT